MKQVFGFHLVVLFLHLVLGDLLFQLQNKIDFLFDRVVTVLDRLIQLPDRVHDQHSLRPVILAQHRVLVRDPCPAFLHSVQLLLQLLNVLLPTDLHLLHDLPLCRQLPIQSLAPAQRIIDLMLESYCLLLHHLNLPVRSVKFNLCRLLAQDNVLHLRPRL